MGLRKLFLIVAALGLIFSCFFPWLIIESRQLVLSGMETEGTTYGKPGVFSLFFSGIILLLSFLPQVWAHRISIVCGAMNTGWAVRNFILLSTCQGGECPQRQTAFYLYLVSSIMLMVAVLIQDIKTKNQTAAATEDL